MGNISRKKLKYPEIQIKNLLSFLRRNYVVIRHDLATEQQNMFKNFI